MILECKDGYKYQDIDYVEFTPDGLQIVLYFGILADDYFFYKSRSDSPIKVSTDNIHRMY